MSLLSGWVGAILVGAPILNGFWREKILLWVGLTPCARLGQFLVSENLQRILIIPFFFIALILLILFILILLILGIIFIGILKLHTSKKRVK